MTGAAKLVLAFHHAGEEDVDVERGDATSNVHNNLWHDD